MQNNLNETGFASSHYVADRKGLLFIVLGTVVGLVVYTAFIGNVEFSSYIMFKKQDPPPIILTWTKYFSEDLAVRLSSSRTPCSHECKITSNRSFAAEADAVILHIRDLDPKHLPQNRSPQQYFAFFLQESPHHTGPALAHIPKDYFNLTMTYRQDSDVFAGYGKLTKATSFIENETDWDYEKMEEDLHKRNKAVLQFVSHCGTPSRREIYTAELQKYINVTVIGNCGIKGTTREYQEKAKSDHLFYLSFENSVCRDYITEKLYSWLGKLVPIVLHRSTYKGIVPDEAFIAADDFKSPADLARHLIYLQNNRSALLDYFKWMKYYRTSEVNSACDLCKLLHERPRDQKIISDIRKWWNHDADCQAAYVSRILARQQAGASLLRTTSDLQSQISVNSTGSPPVGSYLNVSTVAKVQSSTQSMSSNQSSVMLRS